MKEKVKSIYFNEKPQVFVRVIDDNDPYEIKQNKRKYPFELKKTVEVFVITTKRKFKFSVPNGYTWNGADIPRILWRLVGSRTDNDFLIASMLHDYLLEFKVYILKEILKEEISLQEYRRLTSLIFREKIKAQGTNAVKANVMSWCIDVYQHYCNKKGWSI